MIRPATPEDAAACVPLIDIVFEEMEIPALMKLPKSALYPVFERAFLLESYRYGWPHTIVHETDGRVDGILVGYPHSEEATIDAEFMPMLPQLGVTDATDLFPDFESYPGEWYVDTLAVAEAAQGHGIGTELLTGIEKLTKQRGETLLSLNVDQANPRAEQLYKKMGYTKNGELMIGDHRYNHMIKAI